MGLLGDLQIVVVEADHAETERHPQHDPHVRIGGLAHSSVETTMPDRIIRPPMVGVPALVMMCDCGPSVRIGWPLPCSEPQAVDDGRPEQEHEQRAR